MSGDEVYWLDVLPSMRGFGGELTKQATKAAKTAGDKAGKDYKKTFEAGADGSGNALVGELETSQKRAAGLVAKLAGEVSRARQQQARASAELLTAEQRVTDTIDKYGRESNQARAAVLKLEAATEKARAATDKFKRSEQALKEGQNSLKESTGQLETAQRDLGTQTKKSRGFWQKLTSSQEDNEEQSDRNVTSLGKLAGGLAAAAGGAALLTSAFGTGLTQESVGDRLAAQLAATPAQAATYGEAAGALWTDAYGESMEDVGSAVDAVVSSIDGMRDASSAAIEDTTGKAFALKDAFDIDVAESARNVGILMKTGLASDATSAFDLITASLQKVPTALRGEVTDATQEYSAFFSQLGLSGEESMGLLVSSTEYGQYGIDKMGDALKELTIRSTDMSTASVDAYTLAGLSADDMATKFLAGGDTARGALGELVTGLQNIKDPTEQANAAIALFGTPLEDLGTDKIPSFLSQLATMDGSLGDVSGAAGELGETLYDNTATDLESLKRGFMDVVSEGLQPFLKPAEKVLEWVSGILPGIQDVIGILFTGDYSGGLMDSFGIAEDSGFVDFLFNVRDAVLSVGDFIRNTVIPALQSFGGWLVASKDWLIPIAVGIGSVVAALTIWTTVTKTATAIQLAFSTALRANPIGLIVSALAALVAGLVYFFTQTETGRQLWDTFTAAFAAGWEWVAGVISDVWENILKPVWEAVAATATWLWDTILKPIWKAIRVGWEVLSTVVKTFWNNVLRPVLKAVGSVVKWLWDSVISIVWTNIKRGWELVAAGVRFYWRTILKPVLTTIADVVGWLWEKAISPTWTAIKDGWSTVVDSISGVWNDKLKPAFEAVRDFVKETIPNAFEAGKDAIGDAWGKVRDLAAKPINFVIDTVYNNGLRKAVNKVLDFIGGKELPAMPTIPAYARGGRHDGGWALVGEEGPELVNFDNPSRIYTATDTKAMLSGTEQTPDGALTALAGASPSQSALPEGGPFDWVGDTWNTVTSAVGDAARATAQWVRGGLANAASALLEPVRATVRAVLPDQGFTQIPRQASLNGIDDVIDWIRGIDQADRDAGRAVHMGAKPGSMARPSRGPVTSEFGPRWGRQHLGVDIAGGGPTYAAAAGVVQSVGSSAAGGINILLNHGEDLWTYYAHNPSMSAVQVGVGDSVKSGQHIGEQGATGNATGVHLHFEVRKSAYGSQVDPDKYIKYDQGGYLQPGLTNVVNATGRPEPVFTDSQWEAIQAAATSGRVGVVDLSDASIEELAAAIAAHLGLVGVAARNVEAAVRKARTVERMG